MTNGASDSSQRIFTGQKGDWYDPLGEATSCRRGEGLRGTPARDVSLHLVGEGDRAYELDVERAADAAFADEDLGTATATPIADRARLDARWARE
jgi:hypothetical protein